MLGTLRSVAFSVNGQLGRADLHAAPAHLLTYKDMFI